MTRQFESKRVKVESRENRGAAAARNKALGLSQGDYIQWLDADDLPSPDRIVIYLRPLEDSDRVKNACLT